MHGDIKGVSRIVLPSDAQRDYKRVLPIIAIVN